VKIELHSKACSCRGGSWVLMGSASTSLCGGSTPEGVVVVDASEWRSLGKPASVEEYKDSTSKAKTGKERREFKRYAVRLPIRVSRIGSWRNPDVQAEDCETEVVAVGGALVSCRMALEKGDMLIFEHRDFRTRSEVRYVSEGESEGTLRVGLRFLDAPFPDSLIPESATPLT
jgi:hypothetical protein